MYFLELAVIAVIFYVVNSSSRKKEIRSLGEQIRSLEKAVRDLAERAGERQPLPVDGEAEASVRTGIDEDGNAAVAAEAADVAEFPGEGVICTASVAAMIASENEIKVSPAKFKADEAASLLEAAEPQLGEAARAVEETSFSFWDPPVHEEEVTASGGYDTALDMTATEPPPAPAPVSTWKSHEYFRLIMGFIHGGNVWVAAGVIMLLIGFAFLAQLTTFSIEFRIALAAATGMAMVGLGLYLRLRRRMYALIMQGGGIGILYLSAFASAKLTDLLPAAAALVIMTALIVPAVALAVVQNAQVLALFGFVGGFAAPILLSDGSGNYVALFSCYTLLNLGILAICRYRLWRWLNFAGAFCTFVVMGYWGITSYDVTMFPTTEPFLIGFVLIYIVITLGSVRRCEFSFSEPLDAILACAIPFVAALFQWRIAMDIPHGLSISSVLFGAFFLLLAICVWRLWGEQTRRLAEFYLANGVVLANLAVPLELSGNVTSTVWA
ncbi:MAG: DUF2339 domain-containing protein, partial [Deltaproteobacteria bacterium]|nr:DUF2339 domain-containing protein [Deltaproteobacteria bacterium]